MAGIYAGTPPPAPVARMDVIRVTSAESVQFVILSASVWGQGVHWSGSRTMECAKEKRLDCEGCKRGLPWKWKGYLHVTDGKGWSGFLELTPTACKLIETQVGNTSCLRGVIFKIRRTKGGAKGRYIVEVLERRLPDEELPADKDPYATLKYLWSCKRPSGQSAA